MSPNVPAVGRHLLWTGDASANPVLALRPLGIDLRIEGADTALARASRTIFGEPEADQPSSGDLAFSMTVTRGPGDVEPAGLGAFPAAPDGLAYRELAGLYAVMSPCGSLTVADLDGGRASVFLSPRVDLDRSAEALLGSPLWRFAAHQGLVAIHAACVRVAGRSLILRGPGGSGKSTLAMACLLHGQDLLAEDVTWYDARGRSAWLRGLPDRVHLDRRATTLLALEADEREPTDDEASLAPMGARADKRRIRLADDPAWGRRLVSRLAPGPVVFLSAPEASDDRPTQSRWSAVDRDTAASLWREGMIVGETSQDPARLRESAEALLRQGAYRLEPGEPGGAVAALRAIARLSRPT